MAESGRYSYVEGDARLWYKSPEAHNTFIVDGKPFTECTGSWSFGKIALPLESSMHVKDGYAMAEGGHLGYFYLDDPVICKRMIIQVNRKMVFILDICLAKKKHSYRSFYHFPAKDILQIVEEKAIYNDDVVETVLLFPGRSAGMRITPISRHYNGQDKKVTLITEKEKEGICIMPTVVICEQGKTQEAGMEILPVFHAKSDKKLMEEEACAYRVIADGKEWTFLFSIQDTAENNDLLRTGLHG